MIGLCNMAKILSAKFASTSYAVDRRANTYIRADICCRCQLSNCADCSDRVAVAAPPSTRVPQGVTNI